MSATPIVPTYIFVAPPTIPTVAEANTLTTNINAMLAPEVLNAVGSGTQSIPNATWTLVTLTATSGPGTAMTLAANLANIGWGENYQLHADLEWAASTVGRREGVFRVITSGASTYTGADTLVPSAAGATTWPDGSTRGGTDTHTCDAQEPIAAGATVGLWVYQSSGAALILKAATLNITWLDN